MVSIAEPLENGLTTKPSGNMVYLSVLNKNIFVISSARILNDLFNQRSANYSDRPHSTMLNKLYVQSLTYFLCRLTSHRMDLQWIFAFTSYGEDRPCDTGHAGSQFYQGNVWRDTRKMFHSQFQESVVPDLRPMQLKSAHDVLRQILASPDDLFRHLHL